MNAKGNMQKNSRLIWTFSVFFSLKKFDFCHFFVRWSFGADDSDLVCGFSVVKTSTNETIGKKNKRINLMRKKRRKWLKRRGNEEEEEEGEEWKRHYANCELWEHQVQRPCAWPISSTCAHNREPRVRTHTTQTKIILRP